MTAPLHRGRVSLVVASYNHASFLTRRMDSLVGQTYPDIEILVIDDKSLDHSVEILRRYETHPKVRLILREQNGGWVTVSNQGVDLSSGEFVLFANCDDDCDPRMVERLVDALQRHPSAGLAFCRSLMVDENDCVLGDDFEVREYSFRKLCASDAFVSRHDMRRFLLKSCVIPNLSAALIRRDCFNAAGALTSTYRACSDWELFFRIADRFDFCYVAEPLNRFRQHAATIRSATKGRVTYDEFFTLLLGEIPRAGLSFSERLKFRTHVMHLWAVELLRPSSAGWLNFPHHVSLVGRIDPSALLLLPFAILARLAECPGKLFSRLKRRTR